MENNWCEWYQKYLEPMVFLGERPVYPSTQFSKHFCKGNVDWVGRVRKFTKMTTSEVINSSFLQYCEEAKYKQPSQYRMCFSNATAGLKSVSKYDKEQPSLDERSWLLSLEWTKQHFYPYMCGSRVLNQETVIEDMDKTTSCGYPWSLKYHKKSEMLADGKASAVLSDYWDVIGGSNLNHIIPIWTSSQKIELRAVEKLRQNKIRTFTASPIEMSVAAGRLYLDMNNKFYGSCNRTWSYVGGSKYLCGWDNLYNRLSKHRNAFELDESEYDSSLFSRALFEQGEMRWTFLAKEYQTVENRKRHDELYNNIVNSIIVLENGELIQKHTGNPSGSSNTISDNTMILFRLFAYAWIVLCNQKCMKPSYLTFVDNVEAALYGDDNTYTVSDDCLWFDPPAIGLIWSSIGVTTKTPCEKARKLEECSFLSQSFQWNESLTMWLPLPETEKVLSSLAYGSSVDDVRWHLLRACALRIESYANEECNKVIREYIEYLYRVYGDRMIGEVNGLKMNEIFQVWKSDDYIEALYSGKEHKSGVTWDALHSML